MVQTVGQTTGIPQLLHTVIDVPVLQGVLVVDIPVVAQRQIPMVLPVQQTIETPQFRVDKVVDAPVCRSCVSSFSCRDAEADPHGLVDHGDSPVLH